MTCSECDALMNAEDRARYDTVCVACARETAMYQAYGRGIAVPNMWDDVRGRITEEAARRREWRRGIAWTAAMAAVLATVLILTPLVRRPALLAPRVQSPSPPAVVAANKYEAAIATLQAELRTKNSAKRAEAGALLPQLSSVVGRARAAALASPDDPIAVSRLMAAYDAKLELLRDVMHGQT